MKEPADSNKRKTNILKANTKYSRAEKIDIKEEITLVSKGVLFLSQGDYERAWEYFNTVLEGNENNTPSLLGKACIAYNKKRYEEALSLYRIALERNPFYCPANVRLGLGLCYYRLNRMDLAKKCFQRVLQLEPNNSSALAALAVLSLNSKMTNQAKRLLSEAYQRDPTNSAVLSHLSHQYFNKGNREKSRFLAQGAVSHTEVPEIKAEAYYHLAQNDHKDGNFQSAYSNYLKAVQKWPDFVLAQFGLGQMYIHRKEYSKAINCFETVLKRYPDNQDSLKILGSLYAQMGDLDKSC